MSATGEADLLRRAVASCARGAVACKAAYMQTLEQGTEQALLQRCTDRYALLERLIGLLAERCGAAGQVQGVLDGIESDPAAYGGFERALAEAEAAEAALAELLAEALDEGGLPAPVEACFEAALAGLGPSPVAPARARALVPTATGAAAAVRPLRPSS